MGYFETATLEELNQLINEIKLVFKEELDLVYNRCVDVNDNYIILL